jgi:hypothetical protein
VDVDDNIRNMTGPVKKTVDEWLNDISYDEDPNYVPSAFALEFLSFIKLVNGTQGEEHQSPVIHLHMLDKIIGKHQNIANMCSRGLAKTTLLAEYLFLYIAVYGSIPGFGRVDYALYVSDSIENGVKKMRLRIERRCERSPFLRRYIKEVKFTDIRWYFRNTDGKEFVVTGHGAKALSLDTKVTVLDGAHKTIEHVAVGDYVWAPHGRATRVIGKSEVFHRPMYALTLEDGRSVKVCEDHLNSIVVKMNPHNKATYVDMVLPTKELLEYDLQHVRVRQCKGKPPRITRENLLFIRNTAPVDYSPKKYKIDPYTLGLLLGDGSFKKDGSSILTGHVDDFNEYVMKLPDTLGKPYIDKRNTNVMSVAIKGISKEIRKLGLIGHGNYKRIPPSYLIGGVEQRIELLRGLMDSDGSIQKNGRMDFCSNSEVLVDQVSSLVRSLGGTTKKRKMGKAYRIEVWIDINPFFLSRKANRFTGTRVKPLVAIVSITPIADEPSQCIMVEDENHEFLVNDYIRTHNTGVRGTVELNTRPQLAVLDDLISDDDARSETVIASVESTVYSAIDYALHPQKRKIIWSGTPFNAKDPLYKAIESGCLVCECIPCM